MNAAFKILQQSPIPFWKADNRIDGWGDVGVSKEIDRVCGTLKEELGCHDEPPDKVALEGVITGLKRKYQNDDST